MQFKNIENWDQPILILEEFIDRWLRKPTVFIVEILAWQVQLEDRLVMRAWIFGGEQIEEKDRNSILVN